MNRADFQEELLSIMERKVHPSSHAFAHGLVPRAKLAIHLEQEYALFVRDFPIIVGRAYVQCRIPSVRRDLAENLYEEETGAIAAGKPHPVLFLEIPRGYGFELARFENVELLPGSKQYRDVIDTHTQGRGWEPAAAVSTLFIEGTQYERGELDPSASKRPMPPLEEHPLHRHYGLPLEFLALPRVHRGVEGGHRQAAWGTILEHVGEGARPRVLEAMRDALEGWLAYKDEVTRAVGVGL